MKRFVSILILMLVVSLAFAQKLSNTRAETLGERVIITYDLTEGEPGDKFNVTIYSSHNGFSSPLTKVTGDVGPNVKEGTRKRIEWDAKAEIGKYKGALTFEIDVKVIAPFAMKNKVISAKRGKRLPITWRGGDIDESVKIELLKGGKVASTITTAKNNGGYNWEVPSKQEPGKDYAIKLSNGGESITSESFEIKTKYPMWMKIAVPAVVVGTVVLLLPKGSSEREDSGTKLVAPPNILD